MRVLVRLTVRVGGLPPGKAKAAEAKVAEIKKTLPEHKAQVVEN